MILKTLILSIMAITISFSTFSNSRDLNRIKQMDSNENGEISYPVSEITIAGNLKNIFSNLIY